MPNGAGIGNRTNLLGAGKGQGKIDVRGNGGYMIVPPSQRRGAQAGKEGCDGCFYQWDDVEGPGEDFALPVPSQRLIDIITRKEQPAAIARRPSRPSAAVEVPVRERRYVLKAFDEEIRRLASQASGQRNHGLNIASMKVAQLVATGALSDAEARSALESACDANGLIKDDGIKAVRATIASGFKKGLGQPRDLRHLAEVGAGPANSRERAAEVTAKPNAPRKDDRTVIRIRPSVRHEAVDQAESILLATGPGPIYQRGGNLVNVTQRPVLRSDGTADVQEAIAFSEPAFFSRTVAEHARCERYIRTGI
jgi:putative DNA primase/helicase